MREIGNGVFLFLLLCVNCGNWLQAGDLNYKGYPSREGKIDIREYFVSPPKGYGNVPFYWWNGDSLNRERLADQLRILREASTDGLSVSYIHSHPQVDVALNAHGYGSFGKADPGAPGFFTDEWWKIWNWFSGECADAGIGLGLDDYVVGWAGNGYYVDELLAKEDFSKYQGRLCLKTHVTKPGMVLNIKLPKTTVSVTAYPEGIDLSAHVADGKLLWNPGSSQEQRVYVIYTQDSYELHPEYGKRLVDVYFKRFEEKLDANGRRGLNYFFQDELHYPLTMHSWAEDMPEEFRKRKKYDITPYLPALFEDIGNITPKIRLDYAEVLTQLAEERYFKPVFDWHSERGLIYGCDNNGRGLAPLEYVDYFRMTSWFTAPGNDAPARGSSFLQTKVSSSVSHLYERPRTWLEAFHSMGWDSNGEWLTSQLDHHIVAGGNLLCLHGLYYSTHGGWWEWAPPCFHFRMPYWPHMKKWLKYAERLCFLLSQGIHVCDIAVLYPTESMQAYPQEKSETLWKLTGHLSERGLDYDFIDYQSLQKADVENGELSISGEKYKVLILADIKALHHATLQKVLDFRKKGGKVIATGVLPQTTSRMGENDTEVQTMIRELFSSSGGMRTGVIEPDYQKIPALLSEWIIPDFTTDSGTGRVLHRRIGERDVYMVTDIRKGAELFFRSGGKVESWNAKDGSIAVQPVLRQTEEGTWIRFDGDSTVSRLFVFSPGVPVYENSSSVQWEIANRIPVEGNWEVEVIPTLDNKWGDFRLPATDELIGPEVREFTYDFSTSSAAYHSVPVLSSNALAGIYGYAPYMETLTLESSADLRRVVFEKPEEGDWKPYCYSWQYGVFDNPGGQGYHGLKGKVSDGFLILDQGGHQLFRTFVYAPHDGCFRLEQEGIAPDFIKIDTTVVNEKVIHLRKGWHRLLLAYANTSQGSYVLEDKKSNSVDDRKRSAVVLYKEEEPELKPSDPYGPIVAMKWYGTDHLPYSMVGDRSGVWRYQFTTAPATQVMHLKVYGKLRQMWVDGKELDKKRLKRISGTNEYRIVLGSFNSGVSVVTVVATPDKGYEGPSFWAEPVRLVCGKGSMPLNDWSNWGALKYFSGGIRYVKTLALPASALKGKTELDLGSVDATCEVKVNGQLVDVLMGRPFKLDVTPFLKKGKNELEIVVYSSLSNHYQTIPSAYRGKGHAGLIGPVEMVNWSLKP